MKGILKRLTTLLLIIILIIGIFLLAPFWCLIGVITYAIRWVITGKTNGGFIYIGGFAMIPMICISIMLDKVSTESRKALILRDLKDVYNYG